MLPMHRGRCREDNCRRPEFRPLLDEAVSHPDANGALDAAVKEKLDHYQHEYNERNFFFLPTVTTTSGRISGDFLRLL